jgi:hypothetical protein
VEDVIERHRRCARLVLAAVEASAGHSLVGLRQ